MSAKRKGPRQWQLKSLVLGEFAWLICYDITDPGRLAKVHRLVKNEAMPVQYSVYLAWLNDGQVLNLESRVSKIIEPGVDDVRFYHLPRTTQLATLGRQWWPNGVQIFHRGNPVQLGLALG